MAIINKEVEFITIDFTLFDRCFGGQNVYETERQAINDAIMLKYEFSLKGMCPQISVVFSYMDGEIQGIDLDLLIYMTNEN